MRRLAYHIGKYSKRFRLWYYNKYSSRTLWGIALYILDEVAPTPTGFKEQIVTLEEFQEEIMFGIFGIPIEYHGKATKEEIK